VTTGMNRLSKSSGFPDKMNNLSSFKLKPINGAVIKLLVIIAAEKLFFLCSN